MNQSTPKPRAKASPYAPIDVTRRSQQVAAAIGQTILDGDVEPGDLLPPERALAQSFRVTRNTVREALRRLEQLRLVSIRHGSGARVQDYLTTAGVELVGDLVMTRAAGRNFFGDLLVARAVIGEAICCHAIEAFDRRALAGFSAAVDAFCRELERTGEPDRRALMTLDFAVHSKLIAGGGNRALNLLHNSVRHVYERAAGMLELLVDQPHALAEHYRCAERALELGNASAAKAAFRAVFALTKRPRQAGTAQE